MNQGFESQKGLWLGTMDYSAALEKQQQMYSTRRGPFFMGFETPKATVTLGLRAQKDREIVELPEGFECLQTDRGGQATLHSPGQLVVFPVLDLSEISIGPRDLVCQLLKMMFAPLQSVVGEGLQIQQDGLYTQLGKLAFVGMRLRGKRVFHGLSLNVCNDLSLFSNIRSCGRDGARHDSVSEYLKNPEVFQIFEQIFPNSERLDGE